MGRERSGFRSTGRKLRPRIPQTTRLAVGSPQQFARAQLCGNREGRPHRQPRCQHGRVRRRQSRHVGRHQSESTHQRTRLGEQIHQRGRIVQDAAAPASRRIRLRLRSGARVAPLRAPGACQELSDCFARSDRGQVPGSGSHFESLVTRSLSSTSGPSKIPLCDSVSRRPDKG